MTLCAHFARESDENIGFAIQQGTGTVMNLIAFVHRLECGCIVMFGELEGQSQVFDYGFTPCMDDVHEKMIDAVGPECNRVLEERNLPEGDEATSEEVADIIKTAFARCEDLFLGGEQPFQI